jgi:hypothetical protein
MKLTQQSKNCRSIAPQNFSSTRTKRFAESIFSTTLWRHVRSRVKTPNPNLRCKQDLIFTPSSTIISKNSSGTIFIGDWLCSTTGYVWSTSEILTCLVILHAVYIRRTLGIITTLTELPCWRLIYGETSSPKAKLVWLFSSLCRNRFKLKANSHLIIIYPFRGSGGWSAATHEEGPGSNPG